MNIPDNAPSLYFIIAAYNRKSFTIRALALAKASAAKASLNAYFVIYDDGSEDGTESEIRQEHPEAHVIRGSGGSYWAKSMAEAEEYLFSNLSPLETDYVVWMNDDIILSENALTVARHQMLRSPNSIFVGAFKDGYTNALTYSGYSRYGRHPLHLRKVSPEASIIPIDSFNGNLVLIPIKVASKVGRIDGQFSHAWADIDYGLRCADAGVDMFLLPGFQGVCAANPTVHQRAFEAWRDFLAIKGGGNPHSLRRILRRRAPVIWPFYFFSTYILWWLRRATYAIGGVRKAVRDRNKASAPSGDNSNL